jgi:hypothetical protein
VKQSKGKDGIVLILRSRDLESKDIARKGYWRGECETYIFIFPLSLLSCFIFFTLESTSKRWMWHRFTLCCLWVFKLPSYLGSFDTHYIIFRNVEILRIFFFQITKICEEKYWVFKNILFVKMKILKVINYSTAMCWSCKGTRVLFFFTLE